MVWVFWGPRKRSTAGVENTCYGCQIAIKKINEKVRGQVGTTFNLPKYF